MAQRLLDEHADSSEANRRPPTYSPDIRMTLASAITAFAIHGKYTCIAHHQVRIFDTTFDEQPIHTIELKDTGLEFRVKDPRVTAMCFRPGETAEQEGRYVWCGTKDGHLWELDVMTGEVTTQRPSVHSGAVTQILRSHQFILTIDEIGKVHVFEVEQGAAKRDPVKLVRTIRLSDKATFAKMIRGKLWTATAPAARSATTSSGARGPAVRVYDPCASGTSPPGARMALTSEWTGAATSATVMPMDPDKVFLGHEGGYVSIWTLGEELECQQVLKVSSTDILSLEGVGERLWAGNRKGQIHVYDIEPKPWIVTNVWTAHPDQPVHTLVADPWGIATTGRFMLWSCSRDVLHAWDGLLAVDWTGNRMTERQAEYCDFREVRALVCSWNIDSAKPTDLSGPPQNAHFLDEVLHSVESPDIIVFGFQETIPLTDKKLTAKTFLFGSKGKDTGGATKEGVSGAYRAWADKLQSAVGQISTPDSPYVKVHSEQLVGLFSCIFVKASLKNSLRDVNITTVKRGVGGIYGNKGAIFSRMVVDDTSVCFINVHLAAGQSHKGARNADIAAIMEDKAIFPPADTLPYVRGGDGTGVLDHEMVVFSGDLNYRIDQRRDLVESMIEVNDLAYLLERDQLRREMRANHAFRLRSFAEAPITFPPTYKYDPGTDNYDSSEKRRVPAWCDRILFTRTPRLKAINYQRYEINVSDHRPISAGLAVQVKHIDPVRMREVTKQVMTEWRVHEADILATMAKAYEALY
ncbi:hypothetical protein Q8F55_001144 [Vanrija albida]|uniref:Inositol polyphosphate-related phosphatase domain-containing protein n=1 Tax=Vanrija albida TaxID=181172 RepID=A0ABR3QFE4_9TREE